ncbi:MAG: EAL domain-containing protein, partial [Acetobacteraceae bacterium]|nr:EAL domain-containing protein [Acetobacteraceae bacterium]
MTVVVAAAPPQRWLDRMRIGPGVSAKLYAVAFLLLAALAVQAGSSLYFAANLRGSASRLAHDRFDAIARARHVHELVASHRRAIAAAAGGTAATALAAHRDGVAELHGLIAQELAAAGVGMPAANGTALRRLQRDLAEFDLTGAAVLDQGIAAMPNGAAVLQQRLRGFALAADRLGEAVEHWRQDRWHSAATTAAQMFAAVDDAADLAALTGLGTVALGLLGLLVLCRVLGRLGGITGAVLRLARHERDIAIPGRDDPGPIGDIARAVAILANDVGELERRGIAQAKTSQLLDAALNSMVQGLATTDAAGRLQLWNRRFAAILALPDARLRTGMTIAQATASALAPPADHAAAGHQCIVALDHAVVVRVQWVRMSDGGWLGTFDDITHVQRNEARLVHLARHDALTDLPNRTALREAVARAGAQLHQGATFAVLSVNLDRFRTVNDALGHEAGDALLRQAAERLRQHVRNGDTVARIGADSFAIVQTAASPHASPHGGPALLARRLIDVLSEPYVVAGTQVVVGASVGIALPGPAPIDADAMLRNADLARQHARQDGGGTLRFFAAEMDAHAQARRLLELDLRQALERDEFELHYQPLVAVRSRRICAFEALLRWRHGDRGLVRPDQFIPLAEELGLIVPIGEWVLARACAEAATWPEEIGVAVNLSPVQFARDGLVEQVQAAIAAAGIAPARVELEITERVLLRDSADTLATLHRLRALGVRISMDDFGTGYSSLSYLRSFPFDKIKIDKSFVHGLDAAADGGDRDGGDRDGGGSGVIVRAIVALGHSLGIATIAEGVETAAQLNTLVAYGCTEMQGYLFSPPRPAGEIPRLLAADTPWPGEQSGEQ